MSPPIVITKVTGHLEKIALAGDLRYLDETSSRGNWQFTPLTAEQLQKLIGRNRCIFAADPKGAPVRVPPETLPGSNKHTGTISQNYAAQLEEMQRQGKQIYQRVRVIADAEELQKTTSYPLAREHGAVVPLSWKAQVRAQEMSWTAALPAALPAAAGRPILARMLRDAIRSHGSSRHAVKTMTGGKKTARMIVAHNLVVAPHPRVLAQILRAGLAVDQVLEKAARRVIEKMERKRRAQIIAVCSTHLRDSSGIRPHLHLRMAAHDTAGKYIRLFDGKGGGGGGGRCIMQNDIERQIIRTIERERSGKRD